LSQWTFPQEPSPKAGAEIVSALPLAFPGEPWQEIPNQRDSQINIDKLNWRHHVAANSLQELYAAQSQDLSDAEQQIMKALPKMIQDDSGSSIR
jgi:uncharacterized protein YgbK (DUF1537 family)